MLRSLDKHFALAERPGSWPSSWRRSSFDAFAIGYGENIRRHPIQDAAGLELGCALGWLICHTGLLPDGDPILVDAGSSLGERTASLCGRFVLLLHGPEGPELQGDACGLLGVVFARRTRSIASTPALLQGTEPDDELRSAFGIPKRFGWYPFGLTPHRGATRLLPNFALQLNSFRVRRAFQPPSIMGAAHDADRSVRSIHAAVAGNVARLSHGAPAIMHLTAGRDSRMVLSAAIAARANMRLVTIALPSEGARIDCTVAARLARICRLEHEIRPFVAPREEDVAEWLARTDFCVADHVATLASTLKSWRPDELQITGTCGEIGRAFYWHRADRDGPRPTAQEVIRRLGMPSLPRVLEAADAWMSTLPKIPTPSVWDLVYVEQRLGCWAGPATYGSTLRFPSLSPFNQRSIVAQMMALPEEFRLDNRFALSFIAKGSSRLTQIPFNRPSGAARLRYPRRLAKDVLPSPVRAALKRLVSVSHGR